MTHLLKIQYRIRSAEIYFRYTLAAKEKSTNRSKQISINTNTSSKITHLKITNWKHNNLHDTNGCFMLCVGTNEQVMSNKDKRVRKC